MYSKDVCQWFDDAWSGDIICNNCMPINAVAMIN